MAKKKKGIVIALLVLVGLAVLAAIGVVIAAIAIFWLNSEPTLAEIGGIELVVRTETSARDEVIEVYRRRLDGMDVRGELNITRDGDDGIVVQCPGTVDEAMLKQALLMRANLEFRAVAPATEGEGDRAVLWSYEQDPITGQRTPSEAYNLHRDVPVDGSMIREAKVEYDQFQMPYVALEFDDTGRDAFCQLTDEITGSELAIVLDDEVLSAPRVVEPICGGEARITMGAGNVDQVAQDASVLAAAIRAGALPAEVTLESTRVIFPAE